MKWSEPNTRQPVMYKDTVQKKMTLPVVTGRVIFIPEEDGF